MRRTRALLLAALLALTVSVPVSAATTFEVKAIVKENFERAPSDEPCVLDEVAETLTCPGQGNAGRFGELTSSAVYDGVIVTRTLTFRDGSTLTLLEEYGETMFPGNYERTRSHEVLRQPVLRDRTWEIIDATAARPGRPDLAPSPRWGPATRSSSGSRGPSRLPEAPDRPMRRGRVALTAARPHEDRYTPATSAMKLRMVGLLTSA